MRATKIGSLLLALGVVVGGAAAAGLLVGFEPARLPAALLNIAAYKLTFLAAFGLLAAGAVFRRYGRQAAERDGPPGPATSSRRDWARAIRPAGSEVPTPSLGSRPDAKRRAATHPARLAGDRAALARPSARPATRTSRVVDTQPR
jgi:hypothetical protein